MADGPIVFRVMRLTQPELAPPRDGFLLPDLLSDALEAQQPPAAVLEHPFAGRLAGNDAPSDLLCLPQSFGVVYLGTQFSALVTITNASPQPVSLVGIKVEMASERGKALLFDNTGAPLDRLEPGQRQELVIRHDIKELGTHTLTTAATYQPAGEIERRYTPQVFRFSTSNPLVVRTRHRVVGASVFLEATLENATKASMLLEGVQLQAAPPFSACARLPSRPLQSGPLGSYLSQATVVPAEGGAVNFLFQLTVDRALPASSEGAGAPLGRIHIRWRGPMGEPAVLQTQQITLAAAAAQQHDQRREVELSLGPLPAQVLQFQPFSVEARLQNHSERATGPLKLTFAGGGGGSNPRAAGESDGDAGTSLPGPPGYQVVLDGMQSLSLPALQPKQALRVPLQLLPLGCGQQRLAGLLLSDAAGGHIWGVLSPVELFVHSSNSSSSAD